MKRFTCLLLFCLFLGACHFTQGEVSINSKSKVKYRGSGIKATDAKRLGDFLLQQGYFNTLDEQTVYLKKKEGHVTVTFIVDKTAFLADQENIAAGFAVWHQWIKEDVFANAATRIVLADKQLKPLYKIDSTASR